jgi:hypothetical protein
MTKKVSRSATAAAVLVLWIGVALLASNSGAASTSLAGQHAPLESASPAPSADHGNGNQSNGTQTSLDWAGYAVTGPTFSNVAGSWTQPTATCPKKQLQEAAFWVGIDGYSASDPTVEQIGTDSDCTKAKGKKPGGANYYAWYQMFPQPDVVLPTSSYPVAHGDAISASVAVSGSTYTLTIVDGAKWHFSTTQTPSSQPQNSSAEWITEAPCTGSKCKVLPLADFASVTFSSASANNAAISSAGFTDHQIDMTTKGAKKTKAQPSALSAGGSAFTVTWLSN